MDTTETILLYGGTFAPPHKGHLYSLQAAERAIRPNRVLIMPTALPFHKEVPLQEDTELRLQLCRAAFGDMPQVEICDYEIRKGTRVYTADTLEHVKREENEIWLLYGSDMFIKLGDWNRAERIFALASVVCMPRQDDDREALYRQKRAYEIAYRAKIKILEERAYPLSSSEIRQKIRQGEDVSDLLPGPVTEILRREKLYI